MKCSRLRKASRCCLRDGGLGFAGGHERIAGKYFWARVKVKHFPAYATSVNPQIARKFHDSGEVEHFSSMAKFARSYNTESRVLA